MKECKIIEVLGRKVTLTKDKKTGCWFSDKENARTATERIDMGGRGVLGNWRTRNARGDYAFPKRRS